MTAYQNYMLMTRYLTDAERFNADLPAGCHKVDVSWFQANAIGFASKLPSPSTTANTASSCLSPARAS